MSAARAEILARIRGALGPAATAAAERAVTDAGPPPAPGGAAVADLFVARVADYRATVTRCGADEVGAAVAAVCARHGVTTLAVPEGLDPAWVPPEVEALRVGAVDAAAVRALDAVDGVLSTCALGVAETGTIVLDGGAGQGPRAATLLPDLHVCVVHVAQVVAGVEELTAWMGEAIREHGRPLTLISGPSATSDIELDRVEGVHGPRRLEVLVVADQSG